MNETQISTVLSELGLDRQEIEIYLALLKQGPSKAAKLAEETKINRTVVYSFLTKLISKGFVSYIVENNVMWFNSVKPKQLLNLLEEKGRNLKEIIPQLEKIKQGIKEEARVGIYKGVEGGRTVTRDILDTTKELLVFVDTGYFENEFPILVAQFAKERIKREIKIRGLLVEAIKLDKRFSKYAKYRFVPKEYVSPSLSVVYENKVAIVTWSKPLYIVLIEDSDVTRSYKTYFELIWKNARKTTKNDFL